MRGSREAGAVLFGAQHQETREWLKAASWNFSLEIRKKLFTERVVKLPRVMAPSLSVFKMHLDNTLIHISAFGLPCGQ